jgi:hypothetical protein
LYDEFLQKNKDPIFEVFLAKNQYCKFNYTYFI